MGCGNCGSGKDGKPSGCKSNGGCSSGGCNRLNVFDWLNDIPLADFGKPFPFVEVSFSNGSRKDFYKMSSNLELNKGDFVSVEGVNGFDVGSVNLYGELVRLQMKKKRVSEDSKDIKKILRLSSEEDIQKMTDQKAREQKIMVTARVIAKQLKLDMKISEVEIQADGKKATYFYTAEGRVDFRELIKMYSNEFRMRVEMKQIGTRQEAGKVGGIGVCGRELCCSTWLTKFSTVSTSAARYQNLAINQTKLSGQCGRLKCCLNYELDTYMEALQIFPKKADKLQMSAGTAYLQKRDIFKNLMWYAYAGNSKQYPLSIKRVNEILDLNRKGKKADEMRPVELERKATQEKELEFADVVGQISLKSLDRKSNKRRNSNSRNKNKKRKPNRGPQNQKRPSNSNNQKRRRPKKKGE